MSRAWIVATLVAVLSAGGCPGGGDGDPPLPPQMPDEGSSKPADVARDAGDQCAPASFADAVKKVRNIVVNISTAQVVSTGPGLGFPFDLFMDPHFGAKKKVRQGLGSGFVLDAKQGLVVTNNHVIEGASEIVVQLADRREFPAGVVGRDALIDIAILKIPEPAPAQAELGDSEALQVGDWVIAIGNPLGLSHTVTAGVVSALGRSSWDMRGEKPGYADFIQTDASINPGNSGGPLLDTDGRVVGINTAIIKGGQGIGFAIPVNMLKEIKDQLIETGRITRSWMGILIAPVDGPAAKRLGMSSPHGALVGDVVQGGPADRAGFKAGDVILEFGGEKIEDGGRLPWIIARTRAGEAIEVKVLRDGKEYQVEVVLIPMPET
jgi:serine protease Do